MSDKFFQEIEYLQKWLRILKGIEKVTDTKDYWIICTNKYEVWIKKDRSE